MKNQRPAPAVGGTIRVSPVTEELVADLEQAYLRFSLAKPEDTSEVDHAYGALQHRKRELYEHIEDMERLLGRVRSVTKRF